MTSVCMRCSKVLFLIFYLLLIPELLLSYVYKGRCDRNDFRSDNSQRDNLLFMM